MKKRKQKNVFLNLFHHVTRISSVVIIMLLIFSILGDVNVSAACRHKMYSDNYIYTSYEQTNDVYSKNYHYKIHHFKRICKKCNQVIKKDICGEKTFSAHSFFNNQCKACDYKKSSTSNSISNSENNNYVNTTTNIVPKVNYSFNTKGSYIFVNNPEAIRDDYLLDISNEWLYSTLFSGKTKVFVEQTAWHTSGVNYGIQIYNPNNYNVTITFYKGAVAINDWSYSKIWETFEKSSFGFTGISTNSPWLTLPAYGSCWIFPDSNNSFAVRKTAGTMKETYSEDYKNIKITKIIEALLEIESSASVYMNFGAFKDFYKVNMANVKPYSGNKDKFSDWDSDHEQNDQKVYSGIGYKYPLANASLQWTIDDSVKGNLKVKLDDNNESDHWETCNSHTAYDKKQILSSSIYPLYVPLKGTDANGKVKVFNHLIAKNAIDPRSKSKCTYNWADYGVTYKHTISITNKGTKTRTVSYRLSWDTPENSRTIIYHGDDGKQQILRTSNMNVTQKDIKTVNITAGRTELFTVDVTLGGMSNGTLEHSLIVK